jgi:hypothetical protein
MGLLALPCFVMDLDRMGLLLCDNGLRVPTLPPRPLLITYATGCLDRAREAPPCPTRSDQGRIHPGTKVQNSWQFILSLQSSFPESDTLLTLRRKK